MKKMKYLTDVILMMPLFFICFDMITAFIGIFIPAHKIPSHPFDNIELEELKDFSNMKPIINIIKSKDSNLFNETYYPLFGKYKGLKGGHKFRGCNNLFPDSCLEAREKQDKQYCPYDEDSDVLDWNTCIDYISIPEKNYTYYRNSEEKYFYSEKTRNDLNYDILSSMSISKNEKCPENKKSCGLLNQDLILCYDIEDICPINDIIINEYPEYIENNITYKTINLC